MARACGVRGVWLLQRGGQGGQRGGGGAAARGGGEPVRVGGPRQCSRGAVPGRHLHRQRTLPGESRQWPPSLAPSLFSRWTNQTQEARVYSHDGPIRHKKRWYILTMSGCRFLRSSAKIVVKMERNAYKLAMKMGDGLDYVSGLVRGEDK